MHITLLDDQCGMMRAGRASALRLPRRSNMIVVWIVLLESLAVTCFLPTHQFASRRRGLDLYLAAAAQDNFQVVVVGKIILDKYGDPKKQNDDDEAVTIGGGGPQAAFGAACSLAVRDMLLTRNVEKWEPCIVGGD